jgi:hypothetical protein
MLNECMHYHDSRSMVEKTFKKVSMASSTLDMNSNLIKTTLCFIIGFKRRK